MIRSIVVLPADRASGRASDCCLPCPFTSVARQPSVVRSFELEWRRRRRNRRIVCGQIPRPLSVVVWRRKEGNNKEGRKVGSLSHQEPTFLLNNEGRNERTKAEQSVKTGGMAAFLVASPLQTPPPLLVLVRHHHAKSEWWQLW